MTCLWLPPPWCLSLHRLVFSDVLEMGGGRGDLGSHCRTKSSPQKARLRNGSRGYPPASSSRFTRGDDGLPGAGTCQGHRPVGGSRGPRWPRGGGVPRCSPRGCVSTQRVQKVIFQAGAPGGWAGRGRSLEPSRKAGLAASRPPSPAARPSVGVALSRQPHGLGPGAAPPIAPWVTGGRAALWAGRNDSRPLPAPGGDGVGVRGAQTRRGEREMEAGWRSAAEDPSRSRDTSPFQESHPDHSLAPNCSLIGPRAGVEELAVALQAAAERGGFKSIIGQSEAHCRERPLPWKPPGPYPEGHRKPSGG